MEGTSEERHPACTCRPGTDTVCIFLTVGRLGHSFIHSLTPPEAPELLVSRTLLSAGCTNLNLNGCMKFLR